MHSKVLTELADAWEAEARRVRAEARPVDREVVEAQYRTVSACAEQLRSVAHVYAPLDQQ